MPNVLGYRAGGRSPGPLQPIGRGSLWAVRGMDGRSGRILSVMGGSMRIGNRLSGAVFWALVATATALVPAGAGAAERVQPVPLGGAISDQTRDRYFGVYIPTAYGGELTVKTSSGTVSRITGPNGMERQNGQEVGRNQQGWYSFGVTGATQPYTVETTFVQVGLSARRPWNFYYWPTKADAIHEPWAGGNARVDTMQAY